MDRRKALKVVGIGLAGAVGLALILGIWKDRAKETVKSVLRYVKPLARLPENGREVSLEKALNSRCNSDRDGDSSKFHWGKFDRWKELTDEQRDEVTSLGRIPRFTKGIVETRRKNDVLTFTCRKSPADIPWEWVMAEMGMQQQAVCLVCSALGVGMVFSNLGKDGTWVSETEYAAINIRLGAMEPSYKGAYWTSLPPSGKNPWQKGNLPDPVRDGKKPLLSLLRGLESANTSSTTATKESISQLLWAARGRTPHLHNSKPWGMTIPTWAGAQNISSVYALLDNKLWRYVNWDKHMPTHSLSLIAELGTLNYESLLKSFEAKRGIIVLGKNEGFARAVWEVGYQLLNLMLQAKSLDITHAARLLDEREKETLTKIGITDPVAALAL